MKSYRFVLFITSIFMSHILAFAQSNGIQPGTVQIGGPDVIGVGDLNINLSIPVVSKGGIGLPFSMSLTFNNNFWHKVGTSPANWSQTGALGRQGGWFINDPFLGGAWAAGTYTQCNGGTQYIYLGFYDPAGTLHSFASGLVVSNIAGCASSSATQAFTDGEGTATVYAPGAGTSIVTTSSGVILIPRGANSGPSNAPSGNVVVDTNGNAISWNDTNKSYTDTLGITEVTRTGNGTPSSPYVYSYPTQSGNGMASVTLNYATYTVATQFSCTGVSEYPPTSQNLLSSIVLGDGSQYSFTYEITPSDTHTPHYVTGRLASVTWPTGGTTSYTYSGTNCNTGLPTGLTRQTPDGIWTYTPGTLKTTVTSPADSSGHKSVTVYSFAGTILHPTFRESQKQVFQDTTSGTLLLTTVTCYNGNTTNCATASAPTLPITETDVYSTPGGMTQSSHATTFLDSYGSVTQVNAYDFDGTLVRQTVTPIGTWNGTGCSAIGNGIQNRICYRNVYDGSSVIKRSEIFSYDNHGNLTTDTISPVANISQPGNLTKSYAYNANGTIKIVTDINGAQTTYSYNGTGGCNGGLPTSVALPTGATTIFTYDCNGAVISSATDPNNVMTRFAYVDPLWRVTSVTDPSGNVSATVYSPTSVESTFTFGTSAIDVLNQLDSLGRVYIKQRRQGPNLGTADTQTTIYDSNGRQSFSSLAFNCTWGATSCSSSFGTTINYDALGRALSTINSGTGSLSTSFNSQDALITVGPAPPGEVAKKAQQERDGLGRTKSTCRISASSGNTPCGQATGGYNGFPTTFTYDAVGFVLTATRASSSGSQTKTVTRDGLGRILTAHHPEENGNVQFFYDTAPGSPGGACPGTYKGDLVKRFDQNGNTTCFTYDSLHRVISISYAGPNVDGANKYFVYDTASVNGIAMQYGAGKLVEAYTAPSQGGTKITDIGYSYDVLGHLTDVYESTPHAGGYYHTSAVYAANGAIQSFSGLGTQGTFTYGLDGEGRPYSAKQGTNNLVNTISYNAANQPLTVSLGLGDNDTYTYDHNTGRMQSYTFTVGSTPKSTAGNLTWNANGTLRSLAITDGFNSAGTHTCNYGDPSSQGYDDIGRIAKVDCGASVWQQNFSYDAFDNLTKIVPGGGTGISWMPGYNQTNNHYALAGTNYDSNGNLLSDTFHTYTWNQDNHPLTVDSTACGVNGTCITYDAFGRSVEKNVAGTYYQLEYGPFGKVGVMSGQTMKQGYVPLPGGDTFSPSPDTIWHRDWLGSIRVASSLNNRGITFDRAFAPFGELYDTVTGGTSSPDFAGNTQDTIFGEYDTPNREQHPNQGRWISPDPAHAGWNLYAYVTNNPLSLDDPTGLAGDEDLPHLLVNSYHVFLPHVPNQFGGDWDGGTAPGGLVCELDGVQTDCGVALAGVNTGAAAVCPLPGYCRWGSDSGGNPQFIIFDDPISQALYHQGMPSGTILAWCTGPYEHPNCVHTNILYSDVDRLGMSGALFNAVNLGTGFRTFSSFGGLEPGDIAVIGKLGETESFAKQGYDVFNMEGNWFNVSDANIEWVNEVIANEQPVIIASDLTEANLLGDFGLMDANFSTFGTELSMFLDAGYEFALVEDGGEVLLVLLMM